MTNTTPPHDDVAEPLVSDELTIIIAAAKDWIKFPVGHPRFVKADTPDMMRRYMHGISDLAKQLAAERTRADEAERTIAVWRQSAELSAADNGRLRRSGMVLVEAAAHVISEYDGIHRLALAVSDYTKVVANEGGRASNAPDG